MLFRSCKTPRARRSRVIPASVGTTPLFVRLNSWVWKVSSSSLIRLLTADAAICSSSAAPAMVPSSTIVTNSLRDKGSIIMVVSSVRQIPGCRPPGNIT